MTDRAADRGSGSAGDSGRRVLLAPAPGGRGDGRPLFFVFTLRQVAEVLRAVDSLPVPFASPAVPAVAVWRDRVVPVIDLAACFGLSPGSPEPARRHLAVRSGSRWGLIRSGPGIRIAAMPEASPAASSLSPALARGVFESREGLLVAPRMAAILEGAVPGAADESTGNEGGVRMTDRVILVVEDSPTNLRLIVDSLRDDGYAILTAADGEEAVARAVEARPDLMVLDVILPKKNGFQVCRQLRTMPETRDIKILMLTSKNQESDRFWGLRQGADEYMTKPYVMDELRAAVRRLIEPAPGT